MTTYDVSIPTAYAVTKRLMEDDALNLQQRNPYLHLADCCTKALQRHPAWWPVYRAAMRADLPSEFQHAKRKPSRPTATDRAWFVIERLARTLVAASSDPLTLRSAVVRVVEADPDLYDRYAQAIRRNRRARASTHPKRPTRLARGGRT